LALVAMIVAAALAADVEVDTEVEFENEAEVEASKPKRRPMNESLPVRVLDKQHFVPKSRVILVPKGDARARGSAIPVSSAFPVRPELHRAGPHRPHHRSGPAHHKRLHHPQRSTIASVAGAPRKLRSGAPTPTSAKCAALKGTCKPSNTCSGTVVHGLCSGAASITCCTPKAAAAPTTPSAPTGDCPVYANAPLQSLTGNGGVKYSVVRIAPQHFTGTADNTMTKPTACAFARMAAAASAAGIRLTINSGFRTYERQVYFWNCYHSKKCNGGHLAAKPGTSNHGRGQAIDINTGATTTATYRWLAANAAKFGFRRTVAVEPWHWEHTN